MIGCETAPRPACRPEQVPAVVADAPTVSGLHPYTHAHNDYEHDRPLFDALSARIYSVEADVFYGDGAFPVSHDGNDSKGTLQELYLDPIASLVDKGSVYGDGLPFTLVIDIKESVPALPKALHDLLQSYRFGAAVHVILTGDPDMKSATVELGDVATRDSNDYAPDDPADRSWTAYALEWSQYLGWQGGYPIGDSDRRAMACIVENAHANGRSVRFFDGPDEADVWQQQLDEGVRFVSTDLLTLIDDYLR